MPTDIIGGRVASESVARVTEETAERLARHRLRPRAIVLPRRGEITKRAFVRPDQAGWLCGTGCLKIELAGNVLLPEFLYYFMEQRHVGQWLEQHAVGTTMLNLSAGIVGNLPVRYPDPDVQFEIASVLCCYDDLIENNRRRTALLEESVRLLYQEWFVRLRFPGHERVPVVDGVPEGWRRVTLGDYAVLNYGKALKVEDRVDGPIPVYGSSGVIGSHNKALVTAPVIVVGRKGNVGSVFWCPTDLWPIDTVYFISGELADLWLFHTLRLTPFMSTDVAVPGLNRDFAYSRQLLVPEAGIRRAFLETAAPVYQQIGKLSEMNSQLGAARELLLPRLMSGAIVV
ncbi:MAG: restriction endonuclease subunit S [Vicinamibacterales bacterium]